MATQQKVATVEKATEWYKASSGLIFADYRGLKVHEMQELRKSLRGIGAEFHVVKNTLFRRAAGDDIALIPEEYHNGTTATVFIFKEEPACAKAIMTFAKTHGALKIKGGFLNGKALTAKDVDSLSKLPTRDELLSQIVGLVAAPMTNIASILNEVLAGPVRAIAAIEEKVKASAPAAPAKAEPAPEPVQEAPVAEAPSEEAPAEEVVAEETAAPEAAEEAAPKAPAESTEPTETTEGES